MIQSGRIIEAGDTALILQWSLDESAPMDLGVSATAVRSAETIAAAAIAGVLDVVPTFRSVAVHFDPLVVDAADLRRRLAGAVSSCASVAEESQRLHVIPVEYGGSSGCDLAEVAAVTGLAEDEIVHAHTASVYRVFMMGFLPGFAYMGPVDARLTVPRLAAPRARVPAGSVAIAGLQTSVYPMECPGGWRVIGRTTVKPFDPARAEPFLFRTGDGVRFAIA